MNSEPILLWNLAMPWYRLLFAALFVFSIHESVRGAPPRGKDSQPKCFDLYGDPLPEGAISRLGTVKEIYPSSSGHNGAVSTLGWSPDGKTVASAGDNTIRLWEAETGKEVRCIADNM